MKISPLLQALGISLLAILILFAGCMIGSFRSVGRPAEVVEGATYYGAVLKGFDEFGNEKPFYWIVGRRVSLFEENVKERMRDPEGSIQLYRLPQSAVRVIKFDEKTGSSSCSKGLVSIWLHPE